MNYRVSIYMLKSHYLAESESYEKLLFITSTYSEVSSAPKLIVPFCIVTHLFAANHKTAFD